MTVLKVATADQTLIAMERVKIGSGDIESVFLNVEFDDVWESFINKSASFYTSHDSTPHEVLLIDNQCIIPPEVLAKPGTLYIGMIGVSADGKSVKTSIIIGFKISQGAVHGYATITPELNMYQQYLKATKEAVSPVITEFQNEANAVLGAVHDDVEATKADVWASVEPNLLWTNPSPESSFEAQAIPLDLSQYKRFVVTYKAYSTGSGNGDYYGTSWCMEKDLPFFLDGGAFSSEVSRKRIYQASDTQINFQNCTLGSGNDANAYCIPYKIYGFKW